MKTQLEAIQTYPGITTALINIIVHGFEETWMKTLDETSNPLDTTLKQAVKKQQSLTPAAVIKGYIITDWTRVQKQWAIAQKTTFNEGQWPKEVIQALHTLTHSKWIALNEVEHKNTPREGKQQKHEELIQRVTKLYQMD